MRIGIVGAGSIGSLIAGCLAETSCNLLLYGRGLHAAHLTVEGLSIEGLANRNISSDRWVVLLEEQPLPDSVHSSCVKFSQLSCENKIDWLISIINNDDNIFLNIISPNS